jgi:hypothetical protein
MSPEALKVLDKVKKLFALASNEGASEGEKENAMRMAQALLRKHNLDATDVKLAGISETEVGAVEMPHWCKLVYNGVTLLFGVFYYQSGPKTIMVGNPASCATADYVAKFMVESIERQARNLASLSALDRLFVDAPRTRVTEQQREAFRHSAASALYGKCRDLAGPQENESRALARDFLSKQGIHLNPARADRAKYHAAGEAFGKSLNPSAQVGGGNAPLRLGRK